MGKARADSLLHRTGIRINGSYYRLCTSSSHAIMEQYIFVDGQFSDMYAAEIPIPRDSG